MQMRALETGDWGEVLALNVASVRELSELDEPRLRYLTTLAHASLVVAEQGAVVAFALAMAPRTGYDSRNYRWFDSRFERFLYLDRIAVAESARRRAIGTQIYDAMEAAARPFERMVCDVNLVPPNEASLAFHANRGYRELGRLAHGPEKVVALMCKELATGP
jgi:predicted GNAT superfamily acetyltransferase